MTSTLVAIAVLHWIALVVPGANVLVVTQLAASGKQRSALFAALGITTVAFLWASLAVLGVGAVFAAQPVLRIALQVAGGCYLCYVAWRLWRSKSSSGGDIDGPSTAGAAYRLGFLTNIANPKSALFFGSIFASALPAHPEPALLIAAVAVAVFNALAWHSFLAFAFSHARIQAGYGRQRGLLNRIAGVVLGAFGLRLLLQAVEESRAVAR